MTKKGMDIRPSPSGKGHDIAVGDVVVLTEVEKEMAESLVKMAKAAQAERAQQEAEESRAGS